MISLCHMLIQKKIIIISSVKNFAHQCYSVSIDSNEAFEFIFKNDYPDLFNFEPGVLHFQPSMALLHLSNQFMYHMTISGNR